MVNYVKHNDCASTLNIARYIDPKPLFKTTPLHTKPTENHQTECCDVLCNLVWGSAAALQTYLQHFKVNVCVICVPDYVCMTIYLCIYAYLIMYTCKIVMYTCIDNYVYMQDIYVYMQDNYV